MRVSSVVVVHATEARCRPECGSTAPSQLHGSSRLSLQAVQLPPPVAS
jgi:hypothetical protein